MDNKTETIYHLFQSKDEYEGLGLEQQKRNVSLFLKKQLSADNLVFFIGSGCSVPAIPLMSSTMKEIISNHANILDAIKSFLNMKSIDFLIETLECKEECKKLVEEINSLKKELDVKTIADLTNKIQERNKEKLLPLLNEFYENFSDIEALLNWIQNGLNFNPDNQELAGAFKVLKDEFIKTIPTLGDEKYNGGVFDTYAAFYRVVFSNRSEESSKVSIFTTNYDLFNEHGLEANNIAYTTGFPSTLAKKFDINQFKYRIVDDTNRYKDKWQPVFKEANLYKIHGSINWRTDEHGRLYESNHSDESDKVVIYPTMLKHKETAQAPYSELFREFANCLQKKNTTLVVMGYGFPDEHINTIISQNLRNPDFNLIIFGDQNESKLNHFYNEFKESNLHLIGGLIGQNMAHHFSIIVNNFLNDQDGASNGTSESKNE